jgi:cytochrome c551/c552
MYKIRFSLTILVGIILLLTKVNISVSDIETASSKKIFFKQITPPAFDVSKFYQKQCGFCHTKEELIGPDMNKIKAIYIKKYADKTLFIKTMTNFVQNPNKKNAIYKDGIDNFMDMPKMAFKPEQVKAVAEYIYKNNNFK